MEAKTYLETVKPIRKLQIFEFIKIAYTEMRLENISIYFSKKKNSLRHERESVFPLKPISKSTKQHLRSIFLFTGNNIVTFRDRASVDGVITLSSSQTGGLML